MHTGNQQIYPDQFGSGNKYYHEVDHFTDCIVNNTISYVIPKDSAMQSIEIVTDEMHSAEIHDAVKL